MVGSQVSWLKRKLLPLGLISLFFSCQPTVKTEHQDGNEIKIDETKSNTEEALPGAGQELALQTCGSCHLFPSPQLLDKQTWRDRVLPEMALHVGIHHDGSTYQAVIPDSYYEDHVGKVAKSLHLYPDTALLSLQEWQQIENFYYTQAPQTLPAASLGIETFLPSPVLLAEFPSFSLANAYASTTLLEFDPASRRIFLGDKRTAQLYVLDDTFQVKEQYGIEGVPVKIIPQGQKLYVLTMGTLEANATAEGKLLLLEKGRITTVLASLERPVDFALADLTGDGKEEIIIAGFGSLSGSLAWYQKVGSGYKKNVLYDGPGSTVLYPKDLNNDGRLDIAALIAHGREGVFFFLNEGNGSFSQKQVIELPPVYGSSHFSFADMNGDGREDIVLVNGDNADLSPVVKPYHGVRIFRNEGDFQYREDQFFPINGAYKAIAGDFDQNGFQDLAVVSFFPDFSQKPEEGFVLLTQEKDQTFSAHLAPEAREGRWITMTSGDFSGDGKQELLLGSHLMSQGPPVPGPLRTLWAEKKRTLLRVQHQPAGI
jgi:hypothetical protein